MSDQARTLLRQAQAALQIGQAKRAMDSLRRARLLAGDDSELVATILTVMIRIAPDAGLESEREIWQQQLVRLRHSNPAINSTDHAPAQGGRTHASWLGRRVLSAVCILLAVSLFGTGAWYLWRSSQERFTPIANLDRSPPQAPSNVKMPTTRAHSATSFVPPRRSVSQRETFLNDNIGMTFWVQEYTGYDAGRILSVEMPLGHGTAFAIARDGVMLTNKHVIVADAIPTSILVLSHTLSRHGNARLKVCFGRSPERHFDAKIIYESDVFDVAVLKADRTFEHPLTLSMKPVAQQEDVVAYGFPGSVHTIETLTNPNALASHRNRFETVGHLSYGDSFPPSGFDSVATRGIISSPDHRVKGANYHLIDARVSGGNSGGPLLRVSSDEVIGIVSLGGTALETIGNNYALALPQLEQELKEWLP